VALTFAVAATPADLAAFAGLLQAVVAALAAEGRALWTPDEVALPTLLENHPGDFVLGHLAGRPVVGFILQERDPRYWPQDAPGEALYLHKLAVDPAHRGRGLAQTALEFARDHAALLGKQSLKLDTAADRPALRALYEGFGFTAVGERQVGRHAVVLYRLELSDLRHTVPPHPRYTEDS
jgi:ribosomal protein S18 acetylase RimI-like enzyme